MICSPAKKRNPQNAMSASRSVERRARSSNPREFFSLDVLTAMTIAPYLDLDDCDLDDCDLDDCDLDDCGLDGCGFGIHESATGQSYARWQPIAGLRWRS